MILPASLLCCCPTKRGLVVRSMFPKEVASGMIQREKREMIGRVLTDKGALQLNFAVFGDELVSPGEQESGRFRPHTRGQGGEGLESPNRARPRSRRRLARRLSLRLSSLLHATAVVHARGGAQSAASRVTFLKTMTNTIKRTATAQVFDVAKAQADLAALPPPPMEEGDKLVELALDQYEKAILPLLEEGETILARFDGKIYEDSCEPCCVNARTWYPGAMLICLCGVTPKFSKTAVVVTDKTCTARGQFERAYGMCCEEAASASTFSSSATTQSSGRRSAR